MSNLPTMTTAKISVRKWLCTKRAAMTWVETCLNETLSKEDDFFLQLVDGVILCQLMQKISPSLIPRIKPSMQRKSSTMIFKTNENVSFFLQACIEIGVPRHKRFVLHDLVQTQKKERISYPSARRVLDCLESLCEIANKKGKLYDFNVKWPVLDEEKEKFTKEEMDAAEKMIEAYCKNESHKVEVIKMADTKTDVRAAEAKKTERLSQVEIIKKAEMDRINKAATKLQALVKGWHARNKFRALVRHQAYRDYVAQEILTTERVYVEHMEFLFKTVYQPLRNALETNPILTDNEIRAIFSETEVILNINNLLLTQLELRVSKWNVHQRLGDIFLQIVAFLKTYSQYCSNYNEAMRVLQECKKQSKFKKFMDDLRKKSQEIEQRGLEDFLIRPVQRIPRYHLLLQDLVKHTSPDHPDYANLAAAANKVQEVAIHMNEKKREAENIMKVTEIQDMIDGWQDHMEPLAVPHRRFVKEGQVYELSNGTARKQPVVLFLFNDMLIMTKAAGSSLLSRSKSHRLAYKTHLDLVGTYVISLDDTPAFQHGFMVVRKESKRSVTLLALSKEGREEWVSMIETEIADATKQSQDIDTRITNNVSEKINERKAELEQQFHNMISFKTLGSNSGTGSATSSSSEDGSESPKRMSLAEKRKELMAQAKKNSPANALRSGSFSSGTFAAATERP